MVSLQGEKAAKGEPKNHPGKTDGNMKHDWHHPHKRWM
jgi:hypothetical protein